MAYRGFIYSAIGITNICYTLFRCVLGAIVAFCCAPLFIAFLALIVDIDNNLVCVVLGLLISTAVYCIKASDEDSRNSDKDMHLIDSIIGMIIGLIEGASRLFVLICILMCSFKYINSIKDRLNKDNMIRKWIDSSDIGSHYLIKNITIELSSKNSPEHTLLKSRVFFRLLDQANIISNLILFDKKSLFSDMSVAYNTYNLLIKKQMHLANAIKNFMISAKDSITMR